jgi:hypothetical protein
MIDLKRCVFLAVLACGGYAISGAPSPAQERQDLFLTCNVATSCVWNCGPDRGRSCGKSAAVRNYSVSFRQGTITELGDTSRTYSITKLTPSEITVNNPTHVLSFNRITGKMDEFLDLPDPGIGDFVNGQCQKTDSSVEKPKF